VPLSAAGSAAHILRGAAGGAPVSAAADKRDIQFVVDGVRCRGVHWQPGDSRFQSPTGAPCVVMAPPFGGVVDAGLDAFAQRLCAAGLHVVEFDYRHFGASEGEPRQLISIARQIADWRAALDHARGLDGIDPARIVLWGVSFSGGHVIEVAAEDGGVAAVIAQCPMLDGLSALRAILKYAGYGRVLRLACAGLLDVILSALRLGCHRMPIVAPAGRFAMMSADDANEAWHRIAPSATNEACARIALRLGGYRPGMGIRRVNCPVLLQVCTEDCIVTPAPAEAAARRAPDTVTLECYRARHFDLYQGELFEQAVGGQMAFLRRVLGPGEPPPGDQRGREGS